MSQHLSHPISQLLDAVAYAGVRPPAAELDQVVADVVREDLGDSTVTAASLRRQLLEHVDAAVAAHSEGNAGQARLLARQATQQLCDRLPDYRPAPPTKSIAEIVDSIPRSI
jgi:hypothetical protein